MDDKSQPTKADADVRIDVETLERKYAEERDKRLRVVQADLSDEPPLSGKFADFDLDPYADPAFTRRAVKENVDVLVIGGGIGGLLVSARLRQKGIQSLRIIEKGADFGGTWVLEPLSGRGLRCGILHLPPDARRDGLYAAGTVLAVARDSRVPALVRETLRSLQHCAIPVASDGAHVETSLRSVGSPAATGMMKSPRASWFPAREC